MHWSETLPIILLGLRTAVKEDLECSSAELVYGQTLRVPGEIMFPSEQRFRNIKSNIAHHNNENFIFQKISQFVKTLYNNRMMNLLKLYQEMIKLL